MPRTLNPDARDILSSERFSLVDMAETLRLHREVAEDRTEELRPLWEGNREYAFQEAAIEDVIVETIRRLDEILGEKPSRTDVMVVLSGRGLPTDITQFSITHLIGRGVLDQDWSNRLSIDEERLDEWMSMRAGPNP